MRGVLLLPLLRDHDDDFSKVNLYVFTSVKFTLFGEKWCCELLQNKLSIEDIYRHSFHFFIQIRIMGQSCKTFKVYSE